MSFHFKLSENLHESFVSQEIVAYNYFRTLLVLRSCLVYLYTPFDTVCTRAFRGTTGRVEGEQGFDRLKVDRY